MRTGPKEWGYFNLASQQEIFQCSGKEPVVFLNNYCTRELARWETPGVRLGAFLTQKGKLVSDALIANLPDRVLLLFPRGYGNKVKEHLKIYLDLADVVLEDVTQDYTHIVLVGDSIPTDFCPSLRPAAPQEAIADFSYGNFSGRAWVTDRFGAPSLEILTAKKSSNDWETLLSQKGGRAMTEEEVENLRIAAGLPKMGTDMDEENLVAEVGLDQRATSFNKGCYLGQETTARVNTRGHVNRRLVKLRLEKPIHKALPLDVFQGDQVVGRLSSVTHGGEKGEILGLGILSTKVWNKAEPLRLAGGEKVQKV